MSVDIYNAKLDAAQGLDNFIVPPGSEPTEIIGDPRDLGTIERTLERVLDLREARRDNSLQNLGVWENHRYRGPRESYKFNLLLQNIVALGGYVDQSIRGFEAVADSINRQTYETDENLSNLYHLQRQVEFEEFLLSRSSGVQWFE